MAAPECHPIPNASKPTTPAECDKQGGYWAARECWFGKDAEIARCRDQIDNPPGKAWDWDFDRDRCVLVADK
ncbi:hypothetical protein [Actinomadura sp. 3N407]|uniref:hypothetical protein n=1 Tax=Actinomadura sp. 3N407 TaxID=3457423 RepID=UPI003FCD84BA